MEIIIKHIKNPDRIITLSVRPSDRILYIKGKIAELISIPYSTIDLTKDDVLLLDDCTLSEYNIGNHSVIDINKSHLISLNIETKSGKQFNIKACSNEPISVLKNDIFNLKGIPPDQQLLVFAGNSLCEKNYLLDYSVQNNSKIHLYLK